MTPTAEPIEKATAQQKKLIAINTPNKDTKEEWVQWATSDVLKTSTNDLSFDQANKILVQLKVTPVTKEKDNFELFDYKNTQHKRILSQMYTLGWTKKARNKTIPDMSILAHFLKTKSPVKLPLNQMTPKQVSKLIFAIGEIIKSDFK